MSYPKPLKIRIEFEDGSASTMGPDVAESWLEAAGLTLPSAEPPPEPPTAPVATRVGFSTQPKNIFSRMIRWFTKAPCSHAFLVYYDHDFEQDYVMEATEGGFRIVPLNKFVLKNHIVAIIQPKFPIDAGLKEAATWLGEHYDYLGLIGMTVVAVGRWLKRKWNNPLASPRSMFCSEAVTRVLKNVNYPGMVTFEPSTTEPADLLEFFKKEQ